MSELNTILLQAGQAAGGSWSSILMIVAMVVIFYFFMIRPQQRQRKQLKEQREAMKVGDKVVTAGGIHGILREIKDAYAMVEIDKGVVIKISKESIYPLQDGAPEKSKN